MEEITSFWLPPDSSPMIVSGQFGGCPSFQFSSVKIPHHPVLIEIKQLGNHLLYDFGRDLGRSSKGGGKEVFLGGFLKVDGQDHGLFKGSSRCHDPVIFHQENKFVSHGPGQRRPLFLCPDQLHRFIKWNRSSKMHPVLTDDVQFPVKHGREDDRIEGMDMDK